MIVSKDVEIPDSCPDNCPEKDSPLYQGNPCYRCPIFNCTPCPGDGFVLCPPEGYRHDWAVEWKRWFDEGMKGRLCLKLKLEGD